MKLFQKLKPIRCWIDGGDVVDVVDVIGKQSAPRRMAEEFLVEVAREISSVLDYEAFTPPGGLTYIPGEFIVFLSAEDDKEWRGAKRRGLQQGLAHALGQRARELFGRSRLSKSSFAIDLRVDGTLEKGQFRVKAIWDSETDKTLVTPRKFGGQPAVTLNIRDEDEVTVVNQRPRIVLYSIEVRRDGKRQDIVPVTKLEITIGRGSQAVEVDLPIRGDSEVSRLHAIMTSDSTGNYWLTTRGQNPVLINDREVQRDERVQVTPGDQINICSFSLRIQEVASALT